MLRFLLGVEDFASPSSHVDFFQVLHVPHDAGEPEVTAAFRRFLRSLGLEHALGDTAGGKVVELHGAGGAGGTVPAYSSSSALGREEEGDDLHRTKPGANEPFAGRSGRNTPRSSPSSPSSVARGKLDPTCDRFDYDDAEGANNDDGGGGDGGVRARNDASGDAQPQLADDVKPHGVAQDEREPKEGEKGQRLQQSRFSASRHTRQLQDAYWAWRCLTDTHGLRPVYMHGGVSALQLLECLNTYSQDYPLSPFLGLLMSGRYGVAAVAALRFIVLLLLLVFAGLLVQRLDDEFGVATSDAGVAATAAAVTAAAPPPAAVEEEKEAQPVTAATAAAARTFAAAALPMLQSQHRRLHTTDVRARPVYDSTLPQRNLTMMFLSFLEARFPPAGSVSPPYTSEGATTVSRTEEFLAFLEPFATNRSQPTTEPPTPTAAPPLTPSGHLKSWVAVFGPIIAASVVVALSAILALVRFIHVFFATQKQGGLPIPPAASGRGGSGSPGTTIADFLLTRVNFIRGFLPFLAIAFLSTLLAKLEGRVGSWVEVAVPYWLLLLASSVVRGIQFIDTFVFPVTVSATAQVEKTAALLERRTRIQLLPWHERQTRYETLAKNFAYVRRRNPFYVPHPALVPAQSKRRPGAVVWVNRDGPDGERDMARKSAANWMYFLFALCEILCPLFFSAFATGELYEREWALDRREKLSAAAAESGSGAPPTGVNVNVPEPRWGHLLIAVMVYLIVWFVVSTVDHLWHERERADLVFLRVREISARGICTASSEAAAASGDRFQRQEARKVDHREIDHLIRSEHQRLTRRTLIIGFLKCAFIFSCLMAFVVMLWQRLLQPSHGGHCARSYAHIFSPLFVLLGNSTLASLASLVWALSMRRVTPRDHPCGGTARVYERPRGAENSGDPPSANVVVDVVEVDHMGHEVLGESVAGPSDAPSTSTKRCRRVTIGGVSTDQSFPSQSNAHGGKARAGGRRERRRREKEPDSEMEDMGSVEYDAALHHTRRRNPPLERSTTLFSGRSVRYSVADAERGEMAEEAALARHEHDIACRIERMLAQRSKT